MTTDYERVRAARLAGYRQQGIELMADAPDELWEATGWDRQWLYQRLVGRDHLQVMVEDGASIVGVMTQPYRTTLGEDETKKLVDLVSAGFAVDVCPMCSPHYPGATVAVIHYRPADESARVHLRARLHLPHRATG
jgi:hypothetical protein